MSDIETVKSRLDIVDVIGDYIPVKRAGHSYKANCPFHKEKTASFVVTPSLQIYKCFGCGEGGDVLNFIQKIERVEFPEALKIAAEKAGVELTSSYGKKDEKVETEKAKILEANQLSTKYWNYLLKTHAAGKPGRAYLQKRRIRKEELELFQLGYAPPGTNLLPFLLKKGYSSKELVSWGFAIERKGRVIDKFRDRFMMPIWDARGNVVGFSGRIVGPSDYAPKYLNSPETLVYKKGEILMGLHQAAESARKAKILILQEGNIDLLSSHAVGVANIVATGGTALTEAQIKIIKRYADLVLFAFDSDQAGIKALVKGIEIAEKMGLTHKVVPLGDFKDPDDLIQADPSLWAKKIADPANSVEHIFNVYSTDLDLGNPDDKSIYAKRMIPVLQLLKDKVQLSHFTKHLAMMVGVTPDSIDQMLAANPSSRFHNKALRKEDPTPILTTTTANKQEVYLLSLLFHGEQSPNLEISKEVFSDVNAEEIFIQLIKFGNNPDGFDMLADELSDGAKEMFQQVISEDLKEIEDIEKEMLKTYKKIYRRYLQAELRDTSRNLKQGTDDGEQLNRLQYLTRELKQLN